VLITQNQGKNTQNQGKNTQNQGKNTQNQGKTRKIRGKTNFNSLCNLLIFRYIQAFLETLQNPLDLF